MTKSLIAAALITATGIGVIARQDFRSTVDAVAIDVAVLAAARPVAGLTAADFEVTDNGVRQTVREVVSESLAIDVTLVLDTSGSISSKLHESIVRAVKRVQDRLRPADRVSVIEFNERLREALPLTPAPSAAAFAFGETKGQTSFNDAVGLALTAPEPPAGRRQLVIAFTDGIDTTSVLDETSVLRMALHSEKAVFVVAQESPSVLPITFLNELTASTGGVLQVVAPVQVRTTTTRTFPPKLPGDARAPDPFAAGVSATTTTTRVQTPEELLDAAFLNAFEAFRTSYFVRYTLTGVPQEGWHALTIRVTKPGASYTIRARRGYFGATRGR
jgi:VWFA-related protein